MHNAKKHIVQQSVCQRFKPVFGKLLFLSFLLVAGCSLAWGGNSTPAPCTSSTSDSLINDSQDNLIPCSDVLCVIPSQTTVEAPSQSCHVVGRDNTSVSGNGHNASKSDMASQRTFAKCVLKHNRRLRHLSFARATDYYVFFLNILRL